MSGCKNYGYLAMYVQEQKLRCVMEAFMKYRKLYRKAKEEHENGRTERS